MGVTGDGFFGLGLFLGVIGLLVLHHGRGFGLFI